MLLINVSFFSGVKIVFIAIPILVVLCLTLRLVYMIYKISERRKASPVLQKKNADGKVSLLAVLGSGGHTKEMIALLEALPWDKFTPQTYIMADTDKFSAEKLQILGLGRDSDDSVVITIPRSREVNQSYFSSIFSTIYSAIYTFPVMMKCRPDVLLVNGPGTCIPVCFWAFLLNMFFASRTKIIFIESICRVKTLSLSGKMLYLIADYFLVQWPELKENYPLCNYIGRIL